MAPVEQARPLHQRRAGRRSSKLDPTSKVQRSVLGGRVRRAGQAFDMISRRRGGLAAFFLSGVLGLATLAVAPMQVRAGDLAPGEAVLPDGLTTQVRHATGSGSVALEIWIRCPSNGWASSQPGIARLTALATVGGQSGGSSLRDIVRSRGGQLGVSIFQTATEFAILAPAASAPVLQDELVRRIFHPSLDGAALTDAKTRLAEEQAAASQSTTEVLRDEVFSAVFASGPLHGSTFGDSQSLQSASLDDVRAFAARSYVPTAAIVVSLGNGDATILTGRLAATAPRAAAASAVPPSSTAGAPAQPISIASTLVDTPGVALAWAGPPISDQKAATAMDFLSDYLTDQHNGQFAKAAAAAAADATVNGQFVTLENPGLFFVSVSGTAVDPAAMEKTLRNALQSELTRTMPHDQFADAIDAYETRLLRQMDSPQGLADNYGWYFAQNAPAYAPSATDPVLGGAYFANAASLTPEFVRDVARRYLGAPPIVIVVTPHRPANVSPGGT